ncbi:gas vesicle protein [Candidatus Chlorohelix sp.]|uniref:gas vesicle protein n=1 Tax=Candidatus Chlorohelix sp. TaxID=3139201 RepID=UPI00304C5429
MDSKASNEQPSFDFWLAEEVLGLNMVDTNQPPDPEEEVTLLELLDKLLTKGVVISGDLTLSIAGVDLLYIGLRLMISTVDKAVSVGAVRMKNGRVV